MFKPLPTLTVIFKEKMFVFYNKTMAQLLLYVLLSLLSLSPVCPEGQYQPLLSDANECKPCPPQSSTRDEGTTVCLCDANFIRHPDRPDDRCIRKLYIHPAHIEIGKFLDIIVYFASQSVC